MSIITKEKMRRINLRPLFFCFADFVCGALVSQYVFELNVLAIVFSCLVVVSLIILAILPFFKIESGKWKVENDDKKSEISEKNAKKLKVYKIKRLICFCLTAVVFSLGVASFPLTVNSWNSTKYSGEDAVVVGIVDSSVNYDDGLSVILCNVEINGKSEKGNFYCFLGGESKGTVPVGSKILIECEVFSTELYSFKTYDSSVYKNNIKFKTNYADSFVILNEHTRVDETIRLKVAEIFEKYMSERNSSIAFAALFGDKTMVDEEIITSFKLSGIAHLLAVSGLHVGVFAGMLYFILKKLKVRRFLLMIIITVVLLFYCWLCGFSPSAVRAALMAVCLSAAGAFGKQYDALSALSAAGIIILIFSPLSALDYGFLLSFGCVFSIFLLTKPLNKLFTKIKFPKWLATSLAVIFASQIGTAAVLIHIQGFIAPLAFVTNLLAVPLFEIAYTLLIYFAVIVLILPFMGFLFYVPDLILKVIVFISDTVASSGTNIIFTYMDLILGFGIFAVIFIASSFVNLKKHTKLIVCISLSLIVVILSLTMNLSSTDNSASVTFIGLPSQNVSTLVKTENGYDLIDLGRSSLDLQRIQNFLKSSGVSRIENVILNNYSSENLKYAENFLYKFRVNKVICYSSDFDENYIDYYLGSYKFIETDSITQSTVNYSFYVGGVRLRGIYFETDSKTYFLANSNFRKSDFIAVTQNFLGIDFFDVRAVRKNSMAAEISAKTIITYETLTDVLVVRS